MSIAHSCMTANLAIGAWSGQRLDKGASAKVTLEAGAAANTARVNKQIIDKASLMVVTGLARQLRTLFNTRTLPWKDNGDRVLTRKMYQPFIEQFEEMKGQYYAAVDEFATKIYPEERARAEFRMGELFNVNDYPHVSDIRRRFYATLEIDAVTEASDFRVGLDADQIEKIQTRIEKSINDRLAKAMGDVWTRLGTTLEHFALTMAQGDKVFRDSTVDNLTEIIELLPALNIMNDANLTAIYNDVKGTLIGLSPKDLRKNPAVRSAAADEAQRIVDEMQGFMRAFQTPDEE